MTVGVRMRVAVKLYATLVHEACTDALPADRPTVRAGVPYVVELPSGATPEQLMASLGLGADQVRVVFVNGRRCPMGSVLSDGDQVGLFPPIGGG